MTPWPKGIGLKADEMSEYGILIGEGIKQAQDVARRSMLSLLRILV